MKIFSETLLVLALAFGLLSCANRGGVQPAASTADGSQAGSAPASSAPNPEGGVSGQHEETLIFRGNIGKRSIEMRLKRSGENVSGAYSYDGIGQDLSLQGRLDAQGQLALQEFDASGKQTGKFTGKRTVETEEEEAGLISIEGQWSQPNGSHQADFSLTEQPIEFTGGLRIASRLINDRKLNINVSYPQITGSSEPAVASFNRKAEAFVNKAVKDFKDLEPSPQESDYSLNYNVLLATNDFISVEFVEDSYAGGAHPNIAFSTLNYDLRTGRELQLKELFKPAADYRQAIQQYALKELNKRAKEDAQSEGAQGGQGGQGEPPDFTAEDLGDWNTWAMSRNGLYVYFDFPHVIAVYDREFIPYRALKEQMKTDGPAGPFINSAK